jgi:hypothetical protein
MAAAVSDRLGALQELAEQSPRQDRMTPESMTPESMTPESMTPESTIIALWITWLVSWGVAAFWSNRTEKTGWNNCRNWFPHSHVGGRDSPACAILRPS